MNLADLVRTAGSRVPDQTALVSGDQRITWWQLENRVQAVAQGLAELELAAGERVGILLPNSIDFAVSWFAILRTGLVAVPFTRSLTDVEVVAQLASSGAAILVTDEVRAAPLRTSAGAPEAERPPVPRIVVTGSPEWNGWLAAPLAELPDAPDGLAAIVYTSGTSGRPQGVMLTHGALLANVAQTRQTVLPALLPQDIVLLALPLSHIYALNGVLTHVAACGATAVLTERFDPLDSLDLIEREGITLVVGAPPMYVAWSMLPEASRRLSHIRLAVSGAAPLLPDVYARFHEITGLPIYEGYGMTEAGPILTSTLVADEPLPGSVGRPLPGVEVRIVGEDGPLVRPGQEGELVVRGDNLFVGYWPDGSGGPDDEGWFATGDLGRFDEAGNVFLTGRKGDLILVSGFNVSPREVERVLGAHPDIAEVLVVGIPHPYTGQAVKAFIRAREGAELTVDAVNEFVSKRLSRFKSPTTVEIVEAIPVDVAASERLTRRPATRDRPGSGHSPIS